jgi:tetratricopeptide (TPR) repeat protein
VNSSQPARPWTRSPLLPPALIALAVVGCFIPALSAGFTNWDDDYNFTGNPSYRGLSPSHLAWMFRSYLMGHWHPLTWITLGFDYTLWGMNPFGYHLTSVLLHAVNAALLFVVIRRLLALAGSASSSPWPAAAGALFYGVHPLRVESVAWVTERRDVLCGFFTLLTLLAWLERLSEERQGRPGTTWFVWSLIAFAAALMSKALVIMLPAVLLILDVYPLRRFNPGERWRRLLEKVPFGLLSLADLGIMLPAMRGIRAMQPIESYKLLERVAQGAYGLAFYLLKTVWPAGLIPLQRLETPMNPFAAKYVLAAIGVAALTAVLFAFRKRVPSGLTAWLAIIVLVFPVLGFVVTGKQIAADRYTYLALLPASLLVAAFLAQPALPKAAAAAGASLALLALAGMTWRQCGFWKDSVTLWSRQIEFDPNCETAWHDRGKARYEQGDLTGALEDCTRCLEIQPKFPKAYNLRGLLRRQGGDAAGARADFDRAVELNPSYAIARSNRGDLRRSQGDLDGALADAEAALRLDPRLASAYFVRGEVLLRRNRASDALKDYERALALQPDDAVLLVGRGQARMVGGDKAGAASDFERALQLAPPAWPLRKAVEAQLQRVR